MKKLLLFGALALSLNTFSQEKYYLTTLGEIGCGDYCSIDLSTTDNTVFIDDFETFSKNIPELFILGEHGEYIVNPIYKNTMFYVLTKKIKSSDENSDGEFELEIIVEIFIKK